MPGTEPDPGGDPPPPLTWVLFVEGDPGVLEVVPPVWTVLGFVELPGFVVPVAGGVVAGEGPGGDFAGGFELPGWLVPDPLPDPEPDPDPLLLPDGVVVPGRAVVGGDGGAVVGGVTGDFAGGRELPGVWVVTPPDPPPPGDLFGVVVCVVLTGFVTPL